MTALIQRSSAYALGRGGLPMSTGNDSTERARPSWPPARQLVLAAVLSVTAICVAVGSAWAWLAMSSNTVSTADVPELRHAVVPALSDTGSNGAIEAGPSRGVEAASLTATLNNGEFELSGRVPDRAVAARVQDVAAIVYGTRVVDTLIIDPSLSDPSWAPVAGDVVASLPLISNGEIELNGEVVTLRGAAGSEEKRSIFIAAVEQILGADVELVDEVEVIEQLQPVLLIEKRGPAVIKLEGLLPYPQVGDQILDVLAETYIGHSFETDFTFDRRVEETFTLHSLPGLAGMFAKFPVWQLSYIDGRFESSSAGAASFDVDSEALPMDTPALDSFAMSMLGVPAFHLTVIGHTDSSGPATYNQDLSERRAATVLEYLMVEHGIEPTRITAIGRGEEFPITSNATVDGRMKNRRVEILIEIPTS